MSNPKFAHLFIKIGATVIGAIQSIDINDKKESENDCATVYRTLFSKEKIVEIFRQGRVTKESQFLPFNVEYEDDDGLVWKLENAWIKKSNYTFETEDWVIADKMDIEFESLKKK